MKNKYLVLILILAGVIVFGCGWMFARGDYFIHDDDDERGVTMVDGLSVDEMMKEKDLFVLDVHSPEQTHLAGTDEFIPYDKIDENFNKLPKDKNTPILVYCRSGSMSRQASKELVGLGYTKVYDLIGGVKAYNETHYEVSN